MREIAFRFLTEYSWAIENEAPLVNKGQNNVNKYAAKSRSWLIVITGIKPEGQT